MMTLGDDIEGRIGCLSNANVALQQMGCPVTLQAQTKKTALLWHNLKVPCSSLKV